jgi:large-conductance mechanosensitive channel
MKLNLKTILTFCACLLFANNLVAQDVQVDTKVNVNSILIGDQINLELSTTCNPLTHKVIFPEIPDTFNHFEVVSKSLDTSSTRETSTLRERLIITSFDSGKWEIPALQYDIQPLDGSEPFTKVTPAILIQVNTVQVDTSKPFMPIYEIRSAKMPTSVLIMYIVGAIIIALIIGFLIWFLIKTLRDKNAKPNSKIPEIILTPYERARLSLTEIESQKLWQHGEEKRYHTDLSDTIRTYLENQFNIDCFEKTSSEIIKSIRKIKALKDCIPMIKEVFELSDMVKFAKSHPTSEEHELSLEKTKSIIEIANKNHLRLTKIDEQQ